MKYAFCLFLSIFFLQSCLNFKTTDRKADLVDSLKKVYAGNYIGISLNRNQAGTEPLTTQYAYVDEQRSSLAFQLYSCTANDKRYRMATEEGFVKVKTSREQDTSTDMVLIESIIEQKRGYVPYDFIRELESVKSYDER